jgi:hypothetical protein
MNLKNKLKNLSTENLKLNPRTTEEKMEWRSREKQMREG